MTGIIDPKDVYHILRTVLDELPPGVATLEHDEKWGRSQLIPVRKGAAGLYAIGNVRGCEIGIVELTHSHFHEWNEAIEFCRTIVRGNIEYEVWRDGGRVIRARRIHQDRDIIDVMESLETKPEKAVPKETVRFEPYY